MNNIKATIKPKYTYPCTLKNSMQTKHYNLYVQAIMLFVF